MWERARKTVSAAVLLVAGLAPLASFGQCIVPQDCRCAEQPEWAAVVHLTGDAGAVVDSISRHVPGDAGPTDAELAELVGPAGLRYILTPPSLLLTDNFGTAFPIGSDGNVHCFNDSKFEATGWTHSLTTRTCYPRLKAAKAVIEECHDVRRCGVASGGLLPGAGAVLLLLWRRRRTASGRDGP